MLNVTSITNSSSQFRRWCKKGSDILLTNYLYIFTELYISVLAEIVENLQRN
jgi:hypothetical protein